MTSCIPLLAAALGLAAATPDLGPFEGSADIGPVGRAGGVAFDPKGGTYAVTGGGENMWRAADAFHFVWKRCEGDVAIAADIAFPAPGGDPHRKACLLMRASLDPDAAYVDVAVHGDGLTSLQFRDAKGALTREIRSNVAAPRRVRLVRAGDFVQLHLAGADGAMRFSGCAVRALLPGQVLVGLGVCAHAEGKSETATFSKVELGAPAAAAGAPALFSTLETQNFASTDRRVVLTVPGRIEAPNWLRDGKTLVYNAGGRIYRVAAAGGPPEAIDTGFAVRCNNDHGVSPDGTRLAISDQSLPDRKSRVYTLPVGGGAPALVTGNAPSYWHGWSPDGKTVAYCGERGGEFDVYTAPAAGGPETRLTTAKGLDDGPEYAPDGAHIYFNSDRTGRMQLWRMRPDGTGQEQLTSDEFNNWFPHPAPDGRSLVFLSYAGDVKGHPADRDVTLRRMALPGRKVDVLGRFLGGQGTANVPCFAPDGKAIAFVTYQYVR